jgi:hypothetical protein
VRFLRLILVIACLGIGIASAEIVPGVSIKGLADSADLIVVGTVQLVRDTGQGSLSTDARTYKRRNFQAEIIVDETVKGSPVPPVFIFNYSTPAVDSVGNIGYGGLASDTYRIVFLRKTQSGFAFVSPFYPSFPARPNHCSTSEQPNFDEDPYHIALSRILNVLCAQSSLDEKKSALWAINWDDDSAAAPLMKAALINPGIKSDSGLRISLLSHLIRWKDLSVLPQAEDELFGSSRKTEGYLKSNLLLAISGLDPEISVPLLSRALKLPDPDARVGAARFLEYTKSDNALDSLLSALDDPDKNVQFAVMQSLGNITGQHEWRPHPDTLQSDPFWGACIQHWRDFGAQRKTN